MQGTKAIVCVLIIKVHSLKMKYYVTRLGSSRNTDYIVFKLIMIVRFFKGLVWRSDLRGDNLAISFMTHPQ